LLSVAILPYIIVLSLYYIVIPYLVVKTIEAFNSRLTKSKVFTIYLLIFIKVEGY
jgi:hypothetical protein